jgi:hypothetical protein
MTLSLKNLTKKNVLYHFEEGHVQKPFTYLSKLSKLSIVSHIYPSLTVADKAGSLPLQGSQQALLGCIRLPQLFDDSGKCFWGQTL